MTHGDDRSSPPIVHVGTTARVPSISAFKPQVTIEAVILFNWFHILTVHVNNSL